MILTAQQILDTQKHRIEPVELAPGQEVLVRSLPAHVVDGSQKAKNSDAYVFVHSVVGEDGKRLFADDQVDTIAEALAPDVLSLVASKAFSLSIVSEARREEIKKNWQTLRGETSGESPSPSDTPTPT